MNARRLWSFVLMSWCSGSALSQAGIKFATIAPRGTSPVKAMEELSARLKRGSNGTLELKIYPDGVAGDELEVLRKIRMGQIHAGGFTGVGFGEILPEVRVVDLPFLFNDFSEVDAVLDHFFPYFSGRFEEQGFTLLAWVEVGFVHLFSARAIKSPSDMSSLKVWVWAGDPIAEEILRALSVSPVSLPVTDVLTALQTGMVDTVYAHPVGCVGLQWFTKVKTMSEIPLTHATGAVLIKKSVFDRLTKPQQDLLRRETIAEMKRLTDTTRKENEEATDQIRAAGVQTVPFTSLEPFLAASEKARKALTGRIYSQELLSQVLDFLNEYRASSGAPKP